LVAVIDSVIVVFDCVIYLKLNDDENDDVFTERQKCALWIKKLCEPVVTDSDAK